MSENTKRYKLAVDQLAKILGRADWKFDSITGAFVPGSSGQTPIPLPPEALAPYKEITVNDNIVSYNVSKLGLNLFELDITYVGSGQVRIDIDYPIPGLNPPYSTKHLLGTVAIDPTNAQGLKKPKRFSIAAQTIDDGDGTTGTWQISGNLKKNFFVALGREIGIGGVTENIEALVSPQSVLA